MQTVTFDQELKRPVSRYYPKTYMLSDDYVLRYDWRDPLVPWRGVLIDGYNRRRISTDYYIPFSTEFMEFPTYEGNNRFMYC